MRSMQLILDLLCFFLVIVANSENKTLREGMEIFESILHAGEYEVQSPASTWACDGSFPN